MKFPDHIPMPERVARMPRDKRGWPIPFSLLKPDGTSDFRYLVMDQMQRIIVEKLCGVCGEPLDYWKAFIGGPLSTANRVYSDPPMHKECAIYAAAVCPFIVREGWSREHRKDRAELEAINPNGSLARPEQMTISITRRYELIQSGKILVYKIAPPKNQWPIYRRQEDATEPEGDETGANEESVETEQTTAQSVQERQ